MLHLSVADASYVAELSRGRWSLAWNETIPTPKAKPQRHAAQKFNWKAYRQKTRFL